MAHIIIACYSALICMYYIHIVHIFIIYLSTIFYSNCCYVACVQMSMHSNSYSALIFTSVYCSITVNFALLELQSWQSMNHMHTYMITTAVRWNKARRARTSAAGFHISLRLFSAMKVGHGTIRQQNENANGSFIKHAL